MSTARDDILSAVRRAAVARRDADHATDDLELEGPVLPARTQGSPEELRNRFCEMARFAGATVEVVADRGRVPGVLAAFLSREALGDRLVLATDPLLVSLPWRNAPRLQVRPGLPRADDVVSVTGAVAGIAETGSVLVASGAATANALHVLCETHIVLLRAQDMRGSYEEALAMLGATMPRAATFITGPSRTADIEKTPQIGVHGPKRLHILLIAG
jgi:L-lactate dehydrogenase complex protein LldG